MTVLIVGAGIAGLSLGLTLHQIGVPFRIFESVGELRPLGVGINLQPNATRELFDLGLEADLDTIGIRTRQYGFYTKHGQTIWEEPRGLAAGYRWPQISVHRGRLQMMLYHALVQRAGADVVHLGAGSIGYDQTPDHVCLHLTSGTVDGQLLIACDGINSALRAQMYPDEGPPLWSGAVLWRGVAQAQPFFGGAAMALAGHDHQRIVAYPISEPDPVTGDVEMNFIAEKGFDPAQGWRRESWNRAVDTSDILPDFESWVFDWLDVPALIRTADQLLEYPMVDRNPLETWQDGRVTLLGDAAHPTYPVGSSGASQAIVDARYLGACILQNGLTAHALAAYEREMRPRTSKVTLANRGSGPDAIMQRVEDLSSGHFDCIEDIIPQSDLAAHAAHYKDLAGTAISTLNDSPPLIPDTARLV
ncbi:MAG: flavin-dependent oxidoreductase [Rhodobacteraceae bacterium]|nr:flavin-dependent oxidoreductase [Paracoccaceae bacterium]